MHETLLDTFPFQNRTNNTNKKIISREKPVWKIVEKVSLKIDPVNEIKKNI